MAFEANLSPDSGKLDLTIVAQASVITQARAADLLKQVQKVLHETLQSSGNNIISQHENRGIESRRNVPEGLAAYTMPNAPFTWTQDAHSMRQDLALLAKVTEKAIHEHSSIFELGLDSIDVIKLSSRLKRKGIEIPVSAIIKSQTIAKMSLNIHTKSNGSKGSGGKSLNSISRELTSYLEHVGKLPQDAETVLPATPLQQSMVNEMIRSGYNRYFNVDGFKLAADVVPQKLMSAVKQVIQLSPIMRTTFVEIDDPKFPVSYAQIVHQELHSSSENFSVRVLEDGQTIEDFLDNFKAEAVALAVETQALLQVHCVTTGRSQYLVIAISHALYDGTSLRSLHNDIQFAYFGESKSRPDYKPFLEDVFQSTTEGAKTFWRTTLSQLPSSTIPRKELFDHENGSLSMRVERRSRIPLQKIEELCKRSRITIQTLGQTCWALVLSHFMGQLNVVFGSVLSCRDSEEANEVMFPLMNTVAVTVILHGRLAEMLVYMQEMSDTTRQYQHFPLGTAQAYALGSRKDQTSISDTKLFDTLFIYQGRRSTTGNDQLYESVYGASDVEFPVCAEMEIVDGEYISWTTACKSSAAVEAEDIITALESVLEHIVANSEAQTFTTDSEGTSICGLPKFKILETKEKPSSSRRVIENEKAWTTTELTIRKALHELSGVPEDAIRKDSTIFHLGLDSILVLKLPFLLRRYGIRLSVSAILKEQTVFAMAMAADDSETDVNGSLDVDSIIAGALQADQLTSVLVKAEQEIGEIQYAMPATAGQVYMIRQWRASRGAMFYQTFTYILSGPINKTNLEAAWSELLRRHDILRTSFLEMGKDIIQVVFKNQRNEVIYNPRERDPRIGKHRKDLTLPPLNLVVENSINSSVLLKIVLHHALYDGISLPILIDELQFLYQGQALAEPEDGFRTFIAQSISASPPSSMEEKWKSYLEPSTFYHTHSVGGTSATKTRKRTEVFHPLNQIANVKQLAQDSDVSIDALFLAAIAKIYAQGIQSTAANDVVFGIYLANRAPFGEDLSNLAAPTMNLLPLLVRDPLGRSIPELAKGIQKDIHMISSQEMVSASLADIYIWTGVRVTFFVNILKSANPGTSSQLEAREGEWLAVQDLGKRADVVDEILNEKMEVPTNGQCDAYLVSFLLQRHPERCRLMIEQPSVDLEFRYHGKENKLDMGVFAPTEMMTIEEAERMIEEFMRFFE